MDKIRKIHRRIYDNPKNKDGTDKPNEFLGTFEVEKVILEDCYNEEFIGKRKEDGKRCLVKGIEVSGFYHPNQGGIKYEITDIS